MTTVANHTTCMEEGNFNGKSWGQAKPIKTDYYYEFLSKLSHMQLHQLLGIKMGYREETNCQQMRKRKKVEKINKPFGFQNNRC